MIIRLALILFALSTLVLQQAKCEPSETRMPLSAPRIAALEQKLFKRVYSYDPMEKRLQRLELLLFGYSQYGSKGARWAQIQAALNNDHQKNLSLPINAQPPGGNQSDSISEIEKQILKKASPEAPANKRLDTLESKVFGQANPNMPIDQRIERLRRTVGLASPTNPRVTVNPGMDGNIQTSPFVFRFNGRTMPDLGEFGFGDPQISQMLKDMDRQMKEFEQFGNSMPEQAPNGNDKEERHFFYYQWPPNNNQKPYGDLHPNKPPKAQPNIPGLKTPNFDQLPPYSDPNMI